MLFQKRDVKLMIVDDHPGFRGLIRQMFTHATHEIRECASADEAVRCAHEFKPDYVTMDVRMPGLCAFEAIRTIRQSHPPATIVMVSSYNEPELKRRAIDVGAVGYVLKENLFDLPAILKGQPAPQPAATHASAPELPREFLSPVTEMAERLRELELFPAYIGNELRMPIQTIQNFSAILQRQDHRNLSSGTQTCLRRIYDACATMNQRIDALLKYGLTEHKLSQMDPVETDALVHDCWKELAHTGPTLRVSFRVARLPGVRGDAALLRVVFMNLLHNALKFSASRPQPVIEVNCCRTRANAVFAIQDNGIGFAKEHADRLFVPLGRLHPPEKYPGAGLGLALARRIMHLHGGRIWAEAEPDRGATFYLALPGDIPRHAVNNPNLEAHQ